MIKNILIILVVTWGMLFGLSQVAKANDYNTAVVGHIIQSKLQGYKISKNKLNSIVSQLIKRLSLAITLALLPMLAIFGFLTLGFYPTLSVLVVFEQCSSSGLINNSEDL